MSKPDTSRDWPEDAGRTMDKPLQLEITVFDGNGNVVSHDVTEATTATSEQINEMVEMIELGTPAWLAAQLVMQEPRP